MSRFTATLVLWMSTFFCLNFATAQATYYWSHDQKIPIRQDRTAAAIHFSETATVSEIIPQLTENPNITNVEWQAPAQRLLLFFEKSQQVDAQALLKNLGLNSENVRSLSYAYQLQDGFQLWLTHHIVLELETGVSELALADALRGQEVEILKTEFDVTTLEVSNIADVLPLANTLRENGLAKWAHPDFYAKATRYEDPFYDQQFQLNNTGQTLDGYEGLEDIDCNAPEAWTITKGTSSTVVAVIDDGVEDHEDLNTTNGTSRLLGGLTPATNGDGSPNASGAHGEACAGIIAASHNNLGVRGVASEVSLLSVNIFAGGETGAQIAEGINWARVNGADVMSNSWGFTSCELALDVLTNAIDNALTNGRDGKGSIVVFAAGNDGKGCIDYPANISGVISVGAITNQGFRSSYSNYGTDLSLVAPSNGAAGVRTIDRMGSRGYSSGNYTGTFGGTSAACPVVSGVAALVISANPALTETEIRSILLNTATDMGSIGRDNFYGTGRVNAYEALLSATGDDGGGDDDDGETEGYCTSESTDTQDEWISAVRIGSFTKNSGSTTYSDFTNEIIELQAGETYDLSIEVTYGGQTYEEGVRIWVDWNANETFEESEVIFAQAPFTNTASGTFTVPTNATGSTRLRVSMTYENLPPACGTLEYGEVEDYTVKIVEGGGGTICATPTDLVVSGVTTTDATLSWAVAENAQTYDVRVRLAGGEWQLFEAINDTALPLTGFTEGTTYEWGVRSNCGSGQNSDWSTTDSFTFETAPTGYCDAGGEISQYQWIDLVELNNLSNETGNDGGYGDYTNLTAIVQRGTTPTIYISKGPNTNYRFYWTVYIDFNQDGDFTDQDELLLSGSSASNGRLYSNLQIPLSAKLGNTRMRVAMKYTDAAAACEVFQYGEVEDYTIQITETGPDHYSDRPVVAQAEALSGNPTVVEVELYPNPTSDWLMITTDQLQAEAEMFDALGRRIRQMIVNGQREVDVRNLPAGLYQLRVKVGEEWITKPFVKQ